MIAATGDTGFLTAREPRPSIARDSRPSTHRERLRAATRTAHDDVDARYSGFDLTTGAGYRAFLTAHSSVLPALEARLSASGASALLSDWPTRLRTAALADDLRDLGGPDRILDAAPSGSLGTPATLGMMYVLEGSRLGGAVLARRVADNPDAACRKATRYLRHGERQGLWASFLAMFDASPHVRDNEAAVIAGALAAFAMFAGATGDGGSINGILA